MTLETPNKHYEILVMKDRYNWLNCEVYEISVVDNIKHQVVHRDRRVDASIVDKTCDEYMELLIKKEEHDIRMENYRNNV